MTFDEIGAVLGKSPATARVTLFRARQKYRQVFNQLAEGDGNDQQGM
jgi:RNA polymerase sigma-70 factor (ECF subfamily)